MSKLLSLKRGKACICVEAWGQKTRSKKGAIRKDIKTTELGQAWILDYKKSLNEWWTVLLNVSNILQNKRRAAHKKLVQALHYVSISRKDIVTHKKIIIH